MARLASSAASRASRALSTARRFGDLLGLAQYLLHLLALGDVFEKRERVAFASGVVEAHGVAAYPNRPSVAGEHAPLVAHRTAVRKCQRAARGVRSIDVVGMVEADRILADHLLAAVAEHL